MLFADANEVIESRGLPRCTSQLQAHGDDTSIAQFRPFYIVGEVEKPGAYPYTGGLNVLSAIAIAGGTTYRANLSHVLIQHPGDSTMREYDTSAPIPILPGDIIQIPRRYI